MVLTIIRAMRCFSVVLHNTKILNLSLRLKARDFPPDGDIKMKSTTGWNSGGNGTNASGFTALSGGYRGYDGDFIDLGNMASFWSSTEYDTNAWHRNLYYSYAHNVGRGFINKTYGFSSRCVKDQEQACPGTPTVTDIDGNTYNTVLVGDQCWMKENLKTTTYSNGTAIPNVTDDNDWTNLTSGAFVWYDNDITWKDKYGAL